MATEDQLDFLRKKIEGYSGLGNDADDLSLIIVDIPKC